MSENERDQLVMDDQQSAEEYRQTVLDRAHRAFRDGPVSAHADRIRAIIGPKAVRLQGLAQDAVTMLDNGLTPVPAQLAALEEVIRSMRPAPLSRNGLLDDLDTEVAPCFERWDAFRSSVQPLLRSIGRIDLVPEQGVGTGFLVSPGLLLTNKHVMDELSRGTYVLQEGQATVGFGYEYGTPNEPCFSIVQVAAVHPSLDMALLRLEEKSLKDGRPALPVDAVVVKPGCAVVAIGYPFNDSLRNPLFIGAIFGDRFGVKRAAPGEVIRVGRQVIYHDCSTLGGNSGSPILSMETARVVGIHKEGMFRYRNEAVDGASVSDFIRSHIPAL